jgi:hypothetical protein
LVAVHIENVAVVSICHTRGRKQEHRNGCQDRTHPARIIVEQTGNLPLGALKVFRNILTETGAVIFEGDSSGVQIQFDAEKSMVGVEMLRTVWTDSPAIVGLAVRCMDI